METDLFFKKRTILSIFFALLFIACESEAPKKSKSSDGTDNDSNVIYDEDGNPISPTDPERRISPNCGDGILDDNEACDDGNNEDGDGCSADCLFVEPGYSCYPPGEPCNLVAICGDGIVVFPEQCDDGNTDTGDGCSDMCQVEIGWKCEGDPNICSPTVCGDGKIEGAEGCDDGNILPFDGCDDRCQLEPVCAQGGNCVSVCGDGLVMGDEECDDGNNINDDGCSSDCKIEEGYTCEQPEIGYMMDVAIIYNDFTASHPDFEPGATGCDTASLGMVGESLDTNTGKPVFSQSVGSCGTATRLNEWYDHSLNPESVVVSRLKLFDNEQGGYVNQWGEDGTRWRTYTDDQWCHASDCSECNCVAPQVCISPCTWGDAACCANEAYYDGNPFFFPLDGLGITPESEYSNAGIGPSYGMNSWPEEQAALRIADLTPLPGYSLNHNFHFTSEVRFWFEYRDDVLQTLDFTGDDDVWVFINNKLALDLGGIHVPLEGSVDVNALGLTNGHVYEIAVFQAERQTNGSSYRLTLSGFNTSRSICRPECGDGIVGIGEECDDGLNEGGYGKCGPNCKWGPRCGDGVLQKENGEACDDGIENGQPGKCPRSCRDIIIL
jgi:fibro-slime domain-containing protein